VSLRRYFGGPDIGAYRAAALWRSGLRIQHRWELGRGDGFWFEQDNPTRVSGINTAGGTLYVWRLPGI
jgi:hypothetical protein